MEKHPKPDESVAKLRQADVLISPGHVVADAIRAHCCSWGTYYRWRREFGRLNSDQVRRS
ncbi:IS3 family transposase, partial [Methylobacterium sp. J-001]|nr:IS3 family transposase [Methylobacterium sp. J-001]